MATVIIEYADGTGEALTASFEPDILLGNAGRWFPGWVMQPSRYPFVTEYIPYALNESSGEITSGTLTADDDPEESTFPAFTWRLVK
jgi:hypothetical protein